MSSKIVIAIDGFSSTGKSTVAKQLAKHLGYVYVDTGAMYRSVALFALQNNLAKEGIVNSNALIDRLAEVTISFKYNSNLGFSEVYLNGENVEKEIRGMEVSSYVSKVAAISAVRKKLVALQQAMGEEKGIVMDGRDIGTVVFPDAELKLFMTASPETRAQRRFDELIGKGDTTVSYDDVYKNVVERDHIDTTRKDSPLVMANDAVEVDNSNMTREAQFDFILSLVNTKI
ncbi:(d)CMP kinase [Wenyingzhuangia sp. IMCC45574]